MTTAGVAAGHNVVAIPASDAAQVVGQVAAERLLAGTLLAAKALSPACRVYGVEPEAGNDGQQSLRLGSIVSIDVPKTIADGAQTQSLGKIPFELIRRDAADIFTAADSELIDCMRLFASRLKIVVEPTGCLGFAAVRSSYCNA